VKLYTKSEINALPQIDAARDPSGKAWLALVNVDPNRPTSFAASLDGLQARSASGELLGVRGALYLTRSHPSQWTARLE
jgi:hypothetical protein